MEQPGSSLWRFFLACCARQINVAGPRERRHSRRALQKRKAPPRLCLFVNGRPFPLRWVESMAFTLGEAAKPVDCQHEGGQLASLEMEEVGQGRREGKGLCGESRCSDCAAELDFACRDLTSCFANFGHHWRPVRSSLASLILPTHAISFQFKLTL